eukprot:UN12111
MDNLWKKKEVQDKFTQLLKRYGFQEQVIINTIIFGNKLSDENAIHLITYSPWMISEPTLSAETYQELLQIHQKGDSLSSEQAYAPIINEQKNNNNTVDYPYFDDNHPPPFPTPHKEKHRDDDVGLNDALMEIKRNRELIENGPRRWPAHQGMCLYFCSFVFGLCEDD